MTISHEVEVMDRTGVVRFVDEGKSVSRQALGLSQPQEEQHHGQPETEKLGKFRPNLRLLDHF